ncbi:MAG: M15 family metallopeptidase [Candidatus Kapaibacteriota bacterium]
MLVNKYFRKILFLFQFLLLSYLSLFCGENKSDCKEKPNPYNLEIISCIDDYDKQIAVNPNYKLIDLEKLIPNVVTDIRYATKNNFTGKVIYTLPKAFLRLPVAEALLKVQDSLSKLGLGLKIFDAYRPYAATLKFYEVFPDTNFVANPRFGSRHNRGAAVDLTLINLTTKEELKMPSQFDDFSEKAHPDYMNLPEDVIKNRTLLFDIMSLYGFTHYPSEWWHFDYKDWKLYPILNLSFEELMNN